MQFSYIFCFPFSNVNTMLYMCRSELSNTNENLNDVLWLLRRGIRGQDRTLLKPASLAPIRAYERSRKLNAPLRPKELGHEASCLRWH